MKDVGNDCEVTEAVLEQLRKQGIDLRDVPAGSVVKVVCVPHSLGEGLSAMEGTAREHVIMARVDDETLRQLDEWVESGAVSSRSHAAALFIREGLRVRASELSELSEAIAELGRAKARLRERAKRVLGSPLDSTDGGDASAG